MFVIKDSDEFRSFVKDEARFCAMFTADWCPDCQVLKAILPGLETEFDGRFIFATVDRDKFPDMASEFDILGIPSFVTFRRGEVTGTFTSRLGKTRQQIVDFLENSYAKR